VNVLNTCSFLVYQNVNVVLFEVQSTLGYNEHEYNEVTDIFHVYYENA